MTTVKIKFRSSTIDGEQGSIFYQVIHNRAARQQKTNYRLYEHEWNERLSKARVSKTNKERESELSEINNRIKADIKLFQKVISDLKCNGNEYTADDVVAIFAAKNLDCYLFTFMESIIGKLKILGKMRTSEAYESTLCSFKRFRKGKDLLLARLDSDVIMRYEAYLRNNDISSNSSSFYMRNLRAVYNRAVDKGVIPQQYPFKHVYTGVDKTTKRAVPLKVVKRIREIDFSANASLDFARDMFLFSFYTRGMSFIDMAYLRKKDLQHGILSYRRRKTGQQLFIKWEKCMQKIVDKYDTEQSEYLLPIIKPTPKVGDRTQYLYASHNVNRSLKNIGKSLRLPIKLTMYVARHAWASIAKSKKVPISVISEGMGHDSETTTRIYLASLDTMAIDKANSMILNSLYKGEDG